MKLADEARVARAKRLHKQGLNYTEIGNYLGIHRETARQWIDEEAAKKKRADTIAYGLRRKNGTSTANKD